MEACGSAHYWSRQFEKFGHTVKLISPQFVKPYVKANKNDSADAQAIAEAAVRPEMRFVPKKSIQQQDTLLIHRAREQYIKSRTNYANQLRGHLNEYGIIIPKGIHHIRNQINFILEDAENELTPIARGLISELFDMFKLLDQKVILLEKKIDEHTKQDERCKRLMKIEGIGPITASAFVATVGDVSAFKNGRELAAYFGLVPKHVASGNKVKMLGISKRGDRYLRKLLVHGGRSALLASKNKHDYRSQWANKLKDRSCHNVAAVAIANKNTRIAWAVLAHQEEYKHFDMQSRYPQGPQLIEPLVQAQ